MVSTHFARPRRAASLIELIQRAAEVPDQRPAIVTNDRALGYPELLAAVRSAAGTLHSRGIRRFGLVDFDAINVVALLSAAAAVGAEACVYPPSDTLEPIHDLADRFDHDVLISARTDLGESRTVLTPDELLTAPEPDDAPPAPVFRPLLVLTTGTTGVPRGVRHEWSRVVRPFRSAPPAPEQRWLLAYGLHQFGGLQLLLQVMAAGATLVAPTPRRPADGLAAIRTHAVTHASATPTYWRFLLAELRAGDQRPPALQQVTLGGEAVPGRLLAELEQAFPGANVSQVYSANESGSVRSVRDGRNGLPVSVLAEKADADVSLKIVDGELWVRSRIGMLGYYGEDAIEPDAWRPTGDLVEVIGDRIHFRGRRSEIINVGGVKVHPLPVEERISAVPGVQLVRVYGRPNAVTGAIVAAEIVPSPGADPEDLADRVRAACADLADTARPRSIKFVETLATTSDKISRRTPA
jgi:acyl-CoA synthetase (AMP-forming)/AMP-acid ligase II